MSNTPPNVLQLARQGHPDAIAALMNRHLEAQGITARVVQQENTLQVNLESREVPSQADLVAYVRKGITGLELAAVRHLIVSGRQLGADASAWSEALVLASASSDLEFDLDLDAVRGDAAADNDLTSDELALELDFDEVAAPGASDLSDLDAALGSDLNGADLDLDLGLTDSDFDLGAPADFDLDFTDSDGLEARAEPAAADSDLDLSGSDLSSDLSDDNIFDLDLALADEPSADPIDLDFDLGFPEAGADQTDAPADLDFDALGFAEAASVDESTDLDADLDLGFIDQPAEVSSDGDFDLDFDLADDQPAAAADLDLSWIDEPTADRSAEELDLDFDLPDAPEADSFAAELDAAGLSETSGETSAADVGLDSEFDAGFIDSDIPAEAGEATLGTADDLDLAFGTEFGAEFGTEFGDGSLDMDLSEAEVETQNSAAIADLNNLSDTTDLDLDIPPAPPTAPELGGNLDDLWGDDATAPESAEVGLSIDALAAESDLFDTGLSDTSLEEWSDLDNISDDLDAEVLDADAGDADAIAFEDLEFGEEPSPAAADQDDLSAILSTPSEPVFEDPIFEDPIFEDPIFEDLGAAADLDLVDSSLDDRAATPPDLPLAEANTDLETADLGLVDVDLTLDGSTEDFDTSPEAEFDPAANNLSFQLDESNLATDEIDLASADADFDLDFGEEAGQDLDAGLGLDFEEDLDADFGENLSAAGENSEADLGTDWAEPAANPAGVSIPAWEAADDFDPDLVLDLPSDDLFSNPEADVVFDPGLAFDPSAGVETTPNPFAAEAIPGEDSSDTVDTAGFDAARFDAFDSQSAPELASDFDDDLPFSTMELDQTAAGSFVPELALDDSPSEIGAYNDAFLEPSEAYDAEPDASQLTEFSDDADEDLAFESVEFDNDFDAPGAGFPLQNNEFRDDPGFSGASAGDAAGFEDDSTVEFGLADFEDDEFGDNIFSNSSGDSNGFGQDLNGAALVSDEPDAADDFIQEFGSDPSTHVDLAPDRFNDDGSLRRSNSSVPLRLILGLGLGILVLALAGFLLNGLLGRSRQPSGGDSVVMEPVTPDSPSLPADPGAVSDGDLFRQAVNAAQTAANQAQEASTPTQWQEVADTWTLAIDLMRRVPASDPNYAIAQQKAVDYQPNLIYAQQNAQ
ncbi:MAG: hypothetical protein WBG38_18915 [Nodosilinea sp.]